MDWIEFIHFIIWMDYNSFTFFFNAIDQLKNIEKKMIKN